MNIKYYSSKSQPSDCINIDLFHLIIDCPIIAFKRAFYETIFFKKRFEKKRKTKHILFTFRILENRHCFFIGGN